MMDFLLKLEKQGGKERFYLNDFPFIYFDRCVESKRI